jgi:hypothetical protein
MTRQLLVTFGKTFGKVYQEQRAGIVLQQHFTVLGGSCRPEGDYCYDELKEMACQEEIVSGIQRWRCAVRNLLPFSP